MKLEDLISVPFDCLDATSTTKTATVHSLKDLKAGQLLTLTQWQTIWAPFKMSTKELLVIRSMPGSAKLQIQPDQLGLYCGHLLLVT